MHSCEFNESWTASTTNILDCLLVNLFVIISDLAGWVVAAVVVMVVVDVSVVVVVVGSTEVVIILVVDTILVDLVGVVVTAFFVVDDKLANSINLKWLFIYFKY